ncbi:hypothetical protein pb186bvf_005016 [Paramecium bursaria]
MDKKVSNQFELPNQDTTRDILSDQKTYSQWSPL